MLTDLLFIAFFFVTRIGLPMIITLVIGAWIERALNRTAQPRARHTWRLTERHIG